MNSITQNGLDFTTPIQVNMETSGKLAEDTNMYKGVLIKYNEPPEAKKPKLR